MNTLTIRRINWHRYAVAIAIAFMLVVFPVRIIDAMVGQGGLWSEKMIGAGLADSNLVISRDGNGPTPVIGMGAPCTTDAPTNVTLGATTTATLNGTLTNLNGFPNAEVYYEWGYTTNPTTQVGTTTMNAPGADNETITGYDPSQRVYYRFVTKTDAITRGSVRSFVVGGGYGTGYRLVWWGVLLGIIGGLVVGILNKVDSWEEMLAFTILGVVAYYLAQIILTSLW